MCHYWFRRSAIAPIGAARMAASGTIRFLLDGELCELENVDPTETVLNYLRYRAARTGTKEGCAEGDCGACTVVLGELDGDNIRYRAVNACILFMPVLDGKELITVESLRTADGSLHAVQQAMVDTHGSQCGFCTPGIVMSLFSLKKQGGSADRNTIEDALAGNLCRCTGYGPIINAAEQMQKETSHENQGEMNVRFEALRALRRNQTLELTGKSALTGTVKKYYAPVSIDDLADVVEQHPEATILAGGTDVGLWVTKQHRELETVIYVGGVAELQKIEDQGDIIVIGAGVSYTDAMNKLGSLYPDMGELIRRIGSVQIRNSGTIGGNIANGSPIGDSPPALIAAGASLVLQGGDQERTIPLEDYFIDYGKQDLKPGEFVSRVIVPKPTANQHFSAYKLSKRFDQDISAVCGCFRLTIEGGMVTDARICYGGMAATPKRATHAEAAIVGKSWNEETVQAGMKAIEQDYTPLSDMRASADYRLASAKNLLMKAFVETTSDAQTRVLSRGEAANAG